MDQKYIPLDKSWLIRMGVLDLLYGDIQTCLSILSQNEPLSDDLLALERSLQTWNSSGEPVDVGESGTLYRLLLFISWKQDLGKVFKKSGTLAGRDIKLDPSIVNLSQAELLKLDNQTSQWASGAVLCGDPERIEHPPFMLALSYEAWEVWHEMSAQGIAWEPRQNSTIKNQAEAFLRALHGQAIDFHAEQSEDFPFAFAMGLMTTEEGMKLWPSLVGHESNRIKDMPAMIDAAKSGLVITSADHRVVQAVAMWARLNNIEVNFAHPDCVNKSWPQFWAFLEDAR